MTRIVWTMLVGLGFATLARTAEKVDFADQIAPILQQHCIRCHAPASEKSDVSLATIDDLKANDFIRAGDPQSSYLVELISKSAGETPQMPKDADPLTSTYTGWNYSG